jgi:lipid II:glycine glycyltransferase (peptidoglycan interpeptide bridge formation enzyme)
VLDLSKGAEEVFRQFTVSRRRNIRRAIKHNVEVFEALAREDFSAFYEVLLSWRQTERKTIEGPEVPFETFEKACRLEANRRLFLARFSGKIIAGSTVRFFPKGLLECAANASLDGYLDVYPNDLLLWKTVEWGSKEGFPRLSLGGAHPFLRRSGGTVLPIYRYRADRTWIRRYDLREGMLDMGREALHKLPAPLERTIREALGKK